MLFCKKKLNTKENNSQKHRKFDQLDVDLPYTG
jgi:hypothetical protein